MPFKNIADVLLYAYAQNQADEASEEAENTPIQPPAAPTQDQYPIISPEMIMADILGKRLAVHCAEFCQTYGAYSQLLQFYTSQTNHPVPFSRVEAFLNKQDHLGLLRSFEVSVNDARAYAEYWESGTSQEHELGQTLGLSTAKMRKAANAILDYSLQLSAPAMNVLNNCAGQQLQLIKELAGRQNNDARLGQFKLG